MLSGKQRRYLRGLGHHLAPIVQIGKEGLTEGVTAATSAALEDHELIKVKVGEHVDEDRHDLGNALALDTNAELVQVIGRILILYRAREEDPEIKLPKG